MKRAGLLAGPGTTGLCDGSFAQDRDPLNTSNQTTGLSNAVEFLVGP